MSDDAVLTTLQESIAQYQAQLAGVETLLAAAAEADKPGLVELRVALSSAIDQFSADLLALRKARLIQMLQSGAPIDLTGGERKLGAGAASSSSAAPIVIDDADVDADEGSASDGSDLDETGSSSGAASSGSGSSGLGLGAASSSSASGEKRGRFAVGSHCQLLHHAQGGAKWMNVVVHAYDAKARPRYTVLFLTPTELALKPCRFLDSGKCNYGKDCKYSHGYARSLAILCCFALFRNPLLFLLTCRHRTSSRYLRPIPEEHHKHQFRHGTLCLALYQ